MNTGGGEPIDVSAEAVAGARAVLDEHLDDGRCGQCRPSQRSYLVNVVARCPRLLAAMHTLIAAGVDIPAEEG